MALWYCSPLEQHSSQSSLPSSVTAERMCGVLVYTNGRRVKFPVRGRTGGDLLARRSPPRKTTSHRACAHARTRILLLCVCRSPSSRPPFTAPLISYVFLICRHFAWRVRRVLRGSAVIYICTHSFFSAPRSTLQCYTYRRVTLRRAHSLRTVVSVGEIVASVSFFFVVPS